MSILPLTFAIVVALAAVGCASFEGVAPPIQYEESRPENSWLSQTVRFDGVASEHVGTILSGVVEGEPGSLWRWTHGRAVFRFWPVPDASGILEIDLSVVESTLAQTGPVTVIVLVNGARVGEERYQHQGRYRLRYQLPRGGVRPEAPLDVTLVVDPPWISPSDHVDLGVILAKVAVKFENMPAGHAGQ